MRIIFTLLLCGVFGQLIGQTNLKPALRIEKSKQEGQFFAQADLFTLAPSSRSENLQLEVSEYTLLDLRRGDLQDLVRRTPDYLEISFPRRNRSQVTLELYRVEIFTGDFRIQLATGEILNERPSSVHYRGVVRGAPNSIAAVSFTEGKVMGLFSDPEGGNYVIGQVPEAAETRYILYNDAEVLAGGANFCHVEDGELEYTREDLMSSPSLRSAAKCVRLYLEVDNDIYQDKGGQSGTVNYISSLFNEVATLYANESIEVKLSEMFLWNTRSPYSGSDSYSLLRQFQSTRTTINGDLGQLLSYKASGGIAVVNGLCGFSTAQKLSFSSIGSTFKSIPTYSFSVMVVAHEFGHLFGSQHTHACVWNGNNTALDGCAGYTEGSCPTPGLPSGGGTIMSYCHLTSVRINFSKGFGDQPGNLIRNYVARAGCLQDCGTDGGDGGNGDDCGDLFLTLTLDNFGSETTWELLNAQGATVQEGGPYSNKIAGEQIEVAMECLPLGCYDFIIRDEFGDGICCDYGNGSYVIQDANGRIVASGNDFGDQRTHEICIDASGGNGGDGGGNCTEIDFNNFAIESYGGSQDRGRHQLLEGGDVLYMENNAWKSIDLNYTVTENTVIAFDFASSRQGEIHGLGFDVDNNISSNRTFQVYGIQNWGYRNYKDYPGNNSWKTYVIPVGQFYTGAFDRLFFVADHDSGSRNGNSFFRNVRIYEGSGCGSIQPPTAPQTFAYFQGGEGDAPASGLYPNPARHQAWLRTFSEQGGAATLTLYSALGQEVNVQQLALEAGENLLQVQLLQLPGGTYFYRLEQNGRRESGKITIVNP